MDEFLQTLRDPAARHAMLAHAPIALAFFGIVPLFMLAATGFRSRPLRAIVIGCFIVAAGGAWFAAQAGDEARRKILASGQPIGEAAETAMERHHARGRFAWIWPMAPAALIGLTYARNRAVRCTGGTAGVLAAAAVAGWLGFIGHVGGTLVYVHGLGVPSHKFAAPATRTSGAQDGAAGNPEVYVDTEPAVPHGP